MGTLELLVCSECAAKNTIDGAFCRQCGFPLPIEVREEMKAEAEKLLIDGRQLLNDGRTHEAGLVADSVLEVDPMNANALALRGDIFEREGQFQEALETYQRVMEIRPDNAMDRIRVAHLEKLVAAEEIAVEEPRGSKRGVLLVAAAGVLLTSVGAALYFASLNSDVATDKWVASNTENVSGFDELNPTLVPTTPTGAGIQPPGPIVNPTGEGTTNANTGGRVERVQTNPNPGFNNNPGQFRENSLRPDVDLQPWDPMRNGVNRPPTGSENSSGSSSTATPVPDTQPETPAKPEEKEDPGVMELRVRQGSNENSNPGSSAGAMSADALIQKARNLYIQENYSGAAQAYEQAIKAGASTGATYQRLAQCYEKLGRRPDAIRNYRNAANAFDRQIARGNNSESVRAAKESCERAISALGG